MEHKNAYDEKGKIGCPRAAEINRFIFVCRYTGIYFIILNSIINDSL
jgi:hypothetical protein